MKIIQNRIIFEQEERGVSYGERDGIINNVVGLSHNGCSLHSFDQVRRGSLIAIHGLASFAQKMELEKELSTHYLRKLEKFKNYKVIFEEGEPFMEIIQMAKKESVDLIVMGMHGRTGLDQVLFGSTAEKVVRNSRCPVLTIRLPEKRFKMP